jgi:hypothetical protein
MATGAAPEPADAARLDSPKTLSMELKALAEAFAEQEVTLREVMAQLGANASGLFVLILALPFCAPVTIPGLSTPLGLVIAFIAGRYALAMVPWLPSRLLAVKLPPRFFKKVLSGSERFVGWVERRLRPRWNWLTGTPARLRFHGWSICFAALLLALPLGGIPFTNTLPGLAIFIGMLGIMMRDGAAILAGYGLLAGTVVYFGTFAAVFAELVRHVTTWWQN